MVNLKTKVYFVRDQLKGDLETEIRLELVEKLQDRYEDDDE